MKQNVSQINDGITINVDVSVKNIIYVKTLMFVILVHVFVKMENIQQYDEEIKTISTTFNEKNITCKAKNLYILVVFLLIAVTLLIAVSIYCYLIKYQAKQKHLLPFHDTKLKEVRINNKN